MTPSEYFILFTVTALLVLVRLLDRKFQGRVSSDEAENLGRFSRISKQVGKKDASAEMRLAMGIRQQLRKPDDATSDIEDGVPA